MCPDPISSAHSDNHGPLVTRITTQRVDFGYTPSGGAHPRSTDHKGSSVEPRREPSAGAGRVPDYTKGAAIRNWVH